MSPFAIPHVTIIAVVSGACFLVAGQRPMTVISRVLPTIVIRSPGLTDVISRHGDFVARRGNVTRLAIFRADTRMIASVTVIETMRSVASTSWESTVRFINMTWVQRTRVVLVVVKGHVTGVAGIRVRPPRRLMP